MRRCDNCRRPVAAGKSFCSSCGVRLGSVPPPHQSDALRADSSRRQHRGSGWILAGVIVVLVAISGTAIALLVARHDPASRVALSGIRKPAPATSSAFSQGSTPSVIPSVTPSVTDAAEQAGAQNLARLLTSSATERTEIVNAVADVNACGSLADDQQTFQQAATSREQLLAQLNALRDGSALPAQMIKDLAGAWQASDLADQDFAAWAGDENSDGCTPDDSADPSYQAATGPDNLATTDKQAFVSLWNPIAEVYGLPTYQWNQL
jgi:hypothetical protein